MITLAWLARQARIAAQYTRSEGFTVSLLAGARVLTMSALILYLLIATSAWLEPSRRPPNHPVPQFPPFHVDPDSGRIRDVYNRERVFHGVNAVFKAPPWHPPVLDSFHPALSFSPADFAILQSLGLNVVRLGVMWPGVHPARGETNETYLLVMKRMVRQMRAAGIYTLVDFHQDVFGSRFCGEGAPSWLFDEQAATVAVSAAFSASGLDQQDGSSTRGDSVTEDIFRSNAGNSLKVNSSSSTRQDSDSTLTHSMTSSGSIIDGGGGILPCVGFAVCMRPIEYAKSFPEPLSRRFHLLPRRTLDETAETTETVETTETEEATAGEATADDSMAGIRLVVEAETGLTKQPAAAHAPTTTATGADSGAGAGARASSSNNHRWSNYHASDPDPEQCRRHSWSDYHFTYAVARAFQDLYENRWGWRDRMADYWAEVARAFKDEDGLLGYDLINEPWVGDEFSNPMLMAPGVADKLNLAPLYEHLQSAIRAQDPNRLIAFETVTFDDAVSGLRWVPGGRAWRNMSVLSYHHYQPPNIGVRATMKQRMAERNRLKCGAMLTEFSLPSIPVGVGVVRDRDRPAGGTGDSGGSAGSGGGETPAGGERPANRALALSNSTAVPTSGCTVHRKELQGVLQKTSLQWAEQRAQSAAGKAVVKALLRCDKTEAAGAVQVQAEKHRERTAREISNSVQENNAPAELREQERDPGQGAWREFEEILDAADEHVQSWMAWEYKPFHPITGANLGLFHPNGSLNTHLALILARTYPQAVAGRILEFYFNASAASFHLAYSANHPLPPERKVGPISWLSSSEDGEEQVKMGPPPAAAAMEFLTEIFCFRCGEEGWSTGVRVVPATVKWEVKGRMVEVRHEVRDAGKKVDVWITHDRKGGLSELPGTATM
ncbi:hypothetical protein CLOM_g3726 [Closterium sp. NIES-68]|nr:hypothetical protein CLOM_g3726 [Closterium sp. NIES-68]GJP80938.1 hypothetical protein CLOP_g11133 [Closterium sp. NIES-67]